MSQLIDNLNTIESVKTDIKSAIENKGVDMTGVSFPGYASKIGEITTSFVTVPLNVSVNGTYTPGEGVDGYSQVVVDVPAPQFVTETLNVSANGTYNPGQGVDGYSQVNVNVPIDGWDQKSFTEEVIRFINLDNSASFVARNAFMSNITIQTVNLPYATSVGYGAFYKCPSLTQVNLPMCEYISGDAFFNCPSLTQISLPMCSYIGYEAFYGCRSLSIITIGYSSVCRLDNSNVFGNTQITSSIGSIYVTASLVDSYKSAPNWSYFSTQIFPIPE